MPLSRSFTDTVRDRAARDPAFRAALFTEAIQALLAGDLPTAKAALRAYINATVGFDDLAEATGTPRKSLMRMFGTNGNPTATNLAGIIGVLLAAPRRTLPSSTLNVNSHGRSICHQGEKLRGLLSRGSAAASSRGCATPSPAAEYALQ